MNIPTQLAIAKENEYEKEIKRLNVELTTEREKSRQAIDLISDGNKRLREQLTVAVELLKTATEATGEWSEWLEWRGKRDDFLKQYEHTTTSNKPIRPKPIGQGD